MHYLNSRVVGLVAALMLFTAACGGSADPGPPTPSTATSNAISEIEAVDRAESAAAEQGFSTTDLVVKPGLLFGEWQVSFEPASTGSLSGGFLVVLNAQTGEVLDIVTYK